MDGGVLQEYWSGLPFPSPGDLPHPGIEPGSPTLQADALPSEPPGKPNNNKIDNINCSNMHQGLSWWEFSPGEFQGQRSPAGYSPWGHKESNRTERLTLSICIRHCDNSLYPLLLLILPPPKKQ